MKILILCTGNSCRSQMAQGFLKSFDSTLEVQSAGTFPALKVNPRAVKVMAESIIDISNGTMQLPFAMMQMRPALFFSEKLSIVCILDLKTLLILQEVMSLSGVNFAECVMR
jgi:hypothetical protein